MIDLSSRENQLQVLRFFVGGGLTAIADYGTFALLTAIAAPLLIASAASLTAGFIVSFAVNKLWVFGAKGASAQKQTSQQLLFYAALFLFNVGFTYAFIYYAQGVGINAYIAKLITMALILVWNFLLYKKIIFAVNPPKH